MLRNNPMSAFNPLRGQISRKLASRTPLPDARPRSDRFRCAGRESKFLADRQRYWMTTGLLEAAFDLHSGAEVDD